MHVPTGHIQKVFAAWAEDEGRHKGLPNPSLPRGPGHVEKESQVEALRMGSEL